MSKDQLFHCSCYSDITESTLLFEPFWIFTRHAMRKKSLLHPADEDHREFQSLGRVHGHELHAILVLLCLVVTSLERCVCQESLQIRQHLVFDVILELACCIDEFLEVLDSILSLAVTALSEMLR